MANSTRTQLCSARHNAPIQCWWRLPTNLSSGAATSRATDRDPSGPISCGCTPTELRIANVRTSISDPRCAGMRRTHASTSAERFRQCANREPGTPVSKAAGANRGATTSERPKPARVATYFVVELACILCSRSVGAFRSATWPGPLSVQINRAGAAPIAVDDWRQLRCDHCGGSVLPAEIERHTIRIESRIDWEEDKPRRGRPPKWLAEERARAGAR
jgi:hypothetical protein